MLCHMHRFKFAAFLLLFPTIQLLSVGIESAYTRYYEDGEIRPIGQYFGAKLIPQGFRSVIASQPDAPGGQYFIARITDRKSGQISSARMTYFPSDQTKASSHTWDLAGQPLKKWLYLGLTGTDWPDAGVTPLAGKLALLDASGNVLAEWKSFLWEMP